MLVNDAPPLAIPLPSLEACEPSAVAAVLSAFGGGGAGVLIVSGAVPGGAAPCRALARAYACAAHLGGCLPAGDSAVTAALRATAPPLGTDVPQRLAGARTLTAVLQLRWPPGGLPESADGEAAAAAAAADGGGGACARCGLAPGVLRALGADTSAVSARLAHVAAAAARACDRGLAPAGAAPGPLEAALRMAGTAKARLIHYRAAAAQRDSAPAPAAAALPPPAAALHALASLQNWHCDLGLFTVLSAPAVRMCGGGGGGGGGGSAAGGDDGGCGLVVLAAGGARLVLIPPGAVAVQVGEAAAILSAGRLRATPHCVTAGGSCAAAGGRGRCASREIVALFSQPAWATPLRPHAALAAAASSGGDGGNGGGGDDAALCASVLASSAAAAGDARALLPSLAARWAPGDEYGAFVRASAAAYYG
jgi:hypothetical protein